MKTLSFHLARQVAVTLAVSMAVFLFVILLGEGMKDVMGLLVSREVTIWQTLKAVGLLIPFVLAYALPMGLLTAMLLVFGRFSADQELTAARANGISLMSLLGPILILGLACSALSAWILLDLAPRSRVEFKQMVFDFAKQRPEELLASGALIERSGANGYWVYIRRSAGSRLEDVHVTQMKDGSLFRRIEAEGGRVRYDENARQLVLELEKVQAYNRRASGWVPMAGESASFRFDLDPVMEQLRSEPKFSEMTFTQLRLKTMELDLKGVPSMPARTHLHKQVAGSFACVCFTLIGIPLGLRTHRRETIAGVAMALVLVGAYHGLILFAQSMETRADLRPDLLMWLPNALFMIVGAVLLRRANRWC